MPPSSVLTPQSSNVKGWRYDPKTQELHVTFKNGATYRYAGVPKNVSRALRRNKSVGKTVNRMVKKPGYEYEKVAKGFSVDIDKVTNENPNYRKVIYTAPEHQLALMTLPSGGDIGEETHPSTDQFIRVESGKGESVMDGKKHPLDDGTAVVVPAGTKHNIVNTGTKPLKLYTVYSDKQHPDKIVEKTKADAIEKEGALRMLGRKAMNKQAFIRRLVAGRRAAQATAKGSTAQKWLSPQAIAAGKAAPKISRVPAVASGVKVKTPPALVPKKNAMPKAMRTEAAIAIKKDPKAGLRWANKHPEHTEELMALMARYGNPPKSGNRVGGVSGSFRKAFGTGRGMQKGASMNSMMMGFTHELTKVAAKFPKRMYEGGTSHEDQRKMMRGYIDERASDKPPGWGKTLGIGGGVGGGLGALMGVASEVPDGLDRRLRPNVKFPANRGRTMMGLGALGAAIGAGLGALIRSAIKEDIEEAGELRDAPDHIIDKLIWRNDPSEWNRY